SNAAASGANTFPRVVVAKQCAAFVTQIEGAAVRDDGDARQIQHGSRSAERRRTRASCRDRSSQDKPKLTFTKRWIESAIARSSTRVTLFSQQMWASCMQAMTTAIVKKERAV
ncbi:hypothetical protein Dimus_036694, partial [Dionaea muscipula]